MPASVRVSPVGSNIVLPPAYAYAVAAHNTCDADTGIAVLSYVILRIQWVTILLFIAFAPTILKKATAFPNVTMVLNHCGECAGPALFDGKPDVEAKWKQDIETLGKLANVHAKVGGCTMTYNGWEFEKRDVPVGSEELATLLFPIYSHVIKSFGPAKCMFESNFPVDKVCLSYQVLWNAYKRVAASMQLSDEDKAHLFHGTAAKVYGLA